MTTYRRFCCNDLLRFGSVNIAAMTETCIMDTYMCHMAKWPGNCIVADALGGRMTGYIFGGVEGTGGDCTGRLSIISVASKDMVDLVKTLSNLLDDSCDKTYKAYTMTILIPANSFETKYMADELGYILYSGNTETFEMRKPLRRLRTIVREFQNLGIKRRT